MTSPDSPPPRPPRARRFLPPVLALAAFLAALYVTAPPGPGLEPDSLSYVGAAESLVRHGTLRVPTAFWWEPDSTSALGQFPPGFPLAIALPLALGARPVAAARIVIAAAAGVTAWALAAAALAGGALGAVLAATLALIAPGVVNQHWIVLSEPLSYALLALTLCLMALDAERPLAYGAAAAAADMVRYAEVAAVGAAVLWAVGTRGTPRERARRGALALLPAVVFQGLWLARARLVHARTPFAGVGEFTGVAATVHQGIARLGAWLAPSPDLPPWAIPLALAALLAVAALGRHTARRAAAANPRATRFLAALALFVAVYGAVLLFSRTFVGGEIEFDDRILSPVFLCGGAAVGTMTGLAWPGWRRGWRVLAGLALAAWCGAALRVDAGQVRDLRTEGYGYEGADWQETDFAAWLRSGARGFEIFTNDPAAIYFLTGRPSRMLPETAAPDSLRAFTATFFRRPALLVGFTDAYRESPPPDSLARRLGLRAVQSFDYGAAWRRDTAPAPRRPRRP